MRQPPEVTLHEAILGHEVIADLPSSIVIGLTPELVIKIASPLAVRYLPIFAHIVFNAPTIPVAHHLGVFTSKLREYVFMRRMPGMSLDKVWTSQTKSRRPPSSSS